MLKALDPVFDAIHIIAKNAHASETTLFGINFGRASAKAIRDILGVIHIFMGVIPSLIYTLKLLCDVCKSVFTQDNVKLHPFKKEHEMSYNDIAQGDCEKLLVLAAICAKSVKMGSGTFACAASPLITSEIYNKTMLTKHVSGFACFGIEMVYQYVAFQRNLETGGPSEITYQMYFKKMIELTVSLLEKGLQMIYSLSKILHKTAPAWFRLTLTLCISVFGLYKVWIKTE